MSDDGRTPFFPYDSVVRRVDGERVLLLGGGRALLMQLAHPMVAKGVAEHSGFKADPFARLRRTLEASYTISFGTVAQAERTAAAVRKVHERVRGDGYEANDPALLLWVHATLVDTALQVYSRFHGGLSPSEAERYYQESTRKAAVLGCPRSEQPADLAAFRHYMRHMVATLTVGDDARRLGRAIVTPRVPVVGRFARDLTAGLLPAPLRRQYGLAWHPVQDAALEAAALAARLTLPWVPAPLRRAG